jgi:hypothetical protein
MQDGDLPIRRQMQIQLTRIRTQIPSQFKGCHRVLGGCTGSTSMSHNLGRMSNMSGKHEGENGRKFHQEL